MPDHGGNITPSPSSKDDGVKQGRTKDGTKDGTKDDSPKTPTNAKNGKNKLTQIELTPVESLLFFNMVRFNGDHSSVEWGKVAIHSNLKNAASAKVRFRQILKKHGLMDQCPETPRSQAQKRKTVMKSEESQVDDEDGDSSYNPSPGTAKAGVRKRSAPRAAGSRAKRTKGSLTHDQDEEEAVMDSASVAPTTAAKAENKTGIKAEGKTESDTGNDNVIALISDNGVADAIDGTASASPYEHGHSQNPSPQVFGPGAPHRLNPDSRQSALSAHLDNIRAIKPQSLHSGMVSAANNGNGSFGLGQRLSPGQLFQAHHDSQMHAHGGLQAHQLNRFQAPQLFPYQTPGMSGDNLPFGYIGHMQLDQHFPVGPYNGGLASFDQAHLGYDVGYGGLEDESLRGRFDGQDEWDLDNGNVKREASPEAEEPPTQAEWERKDGD